MTDTLKLLESLDNKSRDELSQFIEQENGKAKIQQGFFHIFLNKIKKLYKGILEFTDRCFKRCITNKLGNNLDRTEETCLQNCVDRWLDVNIHLIKYLENFKKRNIKINFVNIYRIFIY
ncbi:hypothetical protein PNEG_03478 [Pneumocystis murina B123]|uniref:Mitochondrial import inner membrane translocase subunit n=1 Tax=Pneumocystis murina (strain B123) TaxID=1069680 RepID=M7P2C5_PNEMU|nr:hypothetical protein PNEG_03478 [Pneumocystis murina B123]EMR08035.1 hypothetical protein PNEG_03478 [Pneumocystis murina B123]